MSKEKTSPNKDKPEIEDLDSKFKKLETKLEKKIEVKISKIEEKIDKIDGLESSTQKKSFDLRILMLFFSILGLVLTAVYLLYSGE